MVLSFGLVPSMRKPLVQVMMRPASISSLLFETATILSAGERNGLPIKIALSLKGFAGY